MLIIWIINGIKEFFFLRGGGEEGAAMSGLRSVFELSTFSQNKTKKFLYNKDLPLNLIKIYVKENGLISKQRLHLNKVHKWLDLKSR